MKSVLFLFLLFSFSSFAQSQYQDINKFTKEVVFKEEFNNNTQLWNIIELYPLNRSLVRGNLQLTSFDQTVFFTRRIFFKTKDDFQIETTIKAVAGDSSLTFGLCFGGNSDKTAPVRNIFGISSGTAKVEAGSFKYDFKIVAKKDVTGLIKNEAYNILTIRKVKKTIYYFVNEELVFTTKFKSFKGNEFGFYLQEETTVLIDNFNVCALKPIAIEKTPNTKHTP